MDQMTADTQYEEATSQVNIMPKLFKMRSKNAPK